MHTPSIAIIDPHHINVFDRTNGNICYNVHGYLIEFIKKYKPIIYLTNLKDIFKIKTFFSKIGESYKDYHMVYGTSELCKLADVLIYFWGGIYKEKKLFKRFNGLKFYHIMDPQYEAGNLNNYCTSIGVDYLFGYNSYDKHSDFVRKYYPNYEGKILGVPFGYAPAWRMTVDYEKRLNKALLHGTMETFLEVGKSTYKERVLEYYNYFNNKFNSMHEIRYLVDKNIEQYSSLVDSKINYFPKMDNVIKDVVQEFNKYKFFINDESLLNFCPIRTYEGMASGAVMIAHNSSCYAEYGFTDGNNCIIFDQINEIKEKINYYSENGDLLKNLHNNSIEYVSKNFNHVRIADYMHELILKKYES